VQYQYFSRLERSSLSFHMFSHCNVQTIHYSFNIVQCVNSSSLLYFAFTIFYWPCSTFITFPLNSRQDRWHLILHFFTVHIKIAFPRNCILDPPISQYQLMITLSHGHNSDPRLLCCSINKQFTVNQGGEILTSKYKIDKILIV